MLRAIELTGFKSFADKTRFEFPKGITVIVGPNGSGKSNVVDAIKWVLGEQSPKSLRGKEMADVIFNGSGSRRPLNAADVTLTLDNAQSLLAVETSEVKITRRVYRSGESEYLINRQPSRLRDIRDLFAGTGVATEAYSVLSDEQKRAQYDRFGHAGVGGGFDFQHAGMGDILSQLQDVFSDFFGGFGGFAGQRRRRGPERGQDVRVEAHISLKDAFEGTKHEVPIRGSAPCETCNGSGAAEGTRPERCAQCGGNGQVTTQRGFIMFSTTCPRCRGTGEQIAKPCTDCSGTRYVEKVRACPARPTGSPGTSTSTWCSKTTSASSATGTTWWRVARSRFPRPRSAPRSRSSFPTAPASQPRCRRALNPERSSRSAARACPASTGVAAGTSTS